MRQEAGFPAAVQHDDEKRTSRGRRAPPTYPDVLEWSIMGCYFKLSKVLHGAHTNTVSL